MPLLPSRLSLLWNIDEHWNHSIIQRNPQISLSGDFNRRSRGSLMELTGYISSKFCYIARVKGHISKEEHSESDFNCLTLGSR